jgi:cytosine/creatinine deaminase
MRLELLLRGGRICREGASAPELLDIRIGKNGRISAIGRALPADGAEVMALEGRLVVPGLVDIHQHLDKSRTRALINNPAGTLEGAIAAYRGIAPTITADDMIARALRTVENCSALGTVAIRTHTNIDPQTGLRGIEAMVAMRERCRDRMHIQVVAHLTGEAPSMLVESEEWLSAALALGADVIGGVPAYSREPLAFMELLFDTAERTGRPLDMHIDEHIDAGRVLFDALARMTRERGLAGRVVAGHSSALGAMPRDDALRTIDLLHEAGVAVVTLPAANLFLQGRSADRLVPRGLTRVGELIARGVPVAAASDNIQDAFVPTGSGDLLEIARWTLSAGHLGINDLGQAFDMVSRIPAGLMELDAGLRVGARADLLVARSDDVESLVAGGARERTVLFGGRVVASTFSVADTDHA